MPRRRRGGVTLMELLVALTLLSLMAGMVALAWRRAPAVPRVGAVTARVLSARDSALRTGHPVTIWVVDSMAGADGVEATALPDGRVLAAAALAINPMTGRPDRAPPTP